MEVIKILNESTPLAEAMDAERVVVATVHMPKATVN